MLDSALWFFIKTRCRLGKGNFKITLSPFLWSLTVSQINLVNQELPDFGPYSANQCIQTQT